MESYSEQYERIKKTGAKPMVRFFPIKPMNLQEEWRMVEDIHVPGVFEGRYQVSNYGNVFDLFNNRYVNIRFDNKGYQYISISTINGSKIVRLNRLVLLVFDYNPNHKYLQANHIDGNPSNNMLYNLEWTTPKENTDHAMLYGLHKMNGTDNPNNKLTESQVREICELIQTGEYFDTEIAEIYNVSYANISDIHKGKIWVRVSKDYDLTNRKPRKFTEKDVREICELLQSGKYFTTEIAEMYNTNHTIISYIRDGVIWAHIGKDYDMKNKRKPRKFTKDQIREICEVIQTGKYIDSEIARMFNTSTAQIGSLRKGKIHTDITKDYDMTIRKSRYSDR